jgi:hypothetical protein
MNATVASVGLMLALSLSTRAHGEGVSLPANQEVPEIMMELQGQILTGLGASFGPSESISFTSTTDVSAKTFSFSSVNGATYAGQPAAITGSGVFNTSTNAWDLSGIGNVMGESWTLSGTAVDPPATYDLNMDMLLLNPVKVIASVEFNVSGNLILSAGVTEVRNLITDALISRSIYADSRVLDGPNKGNWHWSTNIFSSPRGNLSISSNGFSPDEGGEGSFSVAVVPEPATWVLLALGVVAMVCGAAPRNARSRLQANAPR